MKRFTLLTIAALLSVVSFAQKPFDGARTNNVYAPQKVANVTAEATLASPSAVKKAPRKAYADWGFITEQPEGELKTYTRAGGYIDGGYIYNQGGFAQVVFDADGTTVYLKDPVSCLASDTWVKGTLSADGTTITVPMGQPIMYTNDTYGALLLGVTYPTASRTTSDNLTYTVAADGTITLDKYTNYTVGVVGGLFTFNGTVYASQNLSLAWGDYGTVYTPFVEPEVVTPPADLKTETLPFSGSENASTDYASTVQVGWDGNTVYIQGINKYLPEAWVKGTLSGTTVTFPIQYMGKDDNAPYYLTGYSSTGAANVTADYDADTNTFTFNGSIMINTSNTEIAQVVFYNGGIIGNPPTPIEVPEGLETVELPIVGSYYNGSEVGDLAEGATVKVGFVGNEVYFQGLLYDVPEGWVKGTITDDNKVVIETGQYVGKDTTYGSGTYLLGYINGTGITDAVFTYYPEDQLFVSDNLIFSNGKAKEIYYNYYYFVGLTIGVKPTFTVAGEEALLGTAWDINAEDNDMEEVDEWKYELTLSDVPLYAGTYAYKVVKNHSWDTNYGDIETGDQDGNALLTIDEPAYYNVTFSFDYTTLAVSAVATKSKDAEQFVATFVNMPGWETVNAYAWNGEGDAAEQLNGAWPGEAAVKADANFSVPAYSSDFDVYTKTYYFAAPEKIIFNNGNGAQTNDIAFAEKVPFSQHGNGSNVVLFNDGSDQFKAEVEYVPATGTLATYARKFNVGTKQTVVLPFDLPADRIDAAGKFYTPLKIANDQITFTPATEVKANVPYLFEPATEFPFESVEVSAIPVFEQQSVEVGTGEFIYVTETTEVTSDAETTYYGFEGGVFKKAANGVANPWRGYFALPTADATAAKLDIVFDDTTGIEGVETVAADAENTKIYNLQGQQLSKIAGKGVFIVNGKKVLVTK